MGSVDGAVGFVGRTVGFVGKADDSAGKAVGFVGRTAGFVERAAVLVVAFSAAARSTDRWLFEELTSQEVRHPVEAGI